MFVQHAIDKTTMAEIPLPFVLGFWVMVKEFCPEILMIRKLNVKEMEGAEVQAADQLSGGYLIIMRIYCSCGVPN